MPVAYYDFRPSQLPVQIWVLDAGTYELRWHACIFGAGVLEIPGKHEINQGWPVAVVVRDAAGGMSIREP